MRPALAITAVVLVVTAAPAWAGGGYAGIDGSSTPVPTPTYRMFSGHPYGYGYGYNYVAPPASTFNRNNLAPYSSYSRSQRRVLPSPR